VIPNGFSSKPPLPKPKETILDKLLHSFRSACTVIALHRTTTVSPSVVLEY
jgi:hypothetical protein